MKDVIVGDIHLDNKNGDRNFLKYQTLFFNQLISYLKENPTRYVIFLGDIFTNKQIINVNIMDFSLKLFQTISELCEDIILINGNHVIYYKNSYDVDSVNVVFRNRDNLKVRLFKDYLQIEEYVFFNWRDTKEEYIELFSQIKNPEKIKYVFGHFDLFGYMHTRFAENQNKTSLKKEDVFKFFPNLKKIVSGHYHMPQHTGGVLYAGAPYQLSWGEAGLNLGFYTLSGTKFEFIENPEHIYITYNIESKDDIDNIIAEIQNKKEEYNKYYKIIYNNPDFNDIIYNDIKDVLEKRGNKVTVLSNFDLFVNNTEEESEVNLELVESKSNTNGVEMNLESIFKDYIYSLNLEEDYKNDIYINFMNLYKETKMETRNIELL